MCREASQTWVRRPGTCISARGLRSTSISEVQAHDRDGEYPRIKAAESLLSKVIFSTEIFIYVSRQLHEFKFLLSKKAVAQETNYTISMQQVFF